MSREGKSFVVQHRPMGQGLGVVSTHFAPGYTNAHKATKQEAIEYTIGHFRKLIDKTQADIAELIDMSLELEKENDAVYTSWSM